MRIQRHVKNVVSLGIKRKIVVQPKLTAFKLLVKGPMILKRGKPSQGNKRRRNGASVLCVIPSILLLEGETTRSGHQIGYLSVISIRSSL